MTRLVDAYRALHRQAMVPIFVDDDFDSGKLIDACLEAGLDSIEYTLRRRDARAMIPRIRAEYPDVYLLVGSTLDDERIVAHARSRHPQLMTPAELDAYDIDGFVSMVGWNEERIRCFSPRRIVIPFAMTVTEAFRQVAAGAHFVKLSGADLSLVRLCRAAATFDFCPIMVTGGMNETMIPEAFEAGAAVVGAGFDLILKGLDPDAPVRRIAETLRKHVDVAQEAQSRRWPGLAALRDAPTDDWLEALPHYHPFGNGV